MLNHAEKKSTPIVHHLCSHDWRYTCSLSIFSHLVSQCKWLNLNIFFLLSLIFQSAKQKWVGKVNCGQIGLISQRVPRRGYSLSIKPHLHIIITKYNTIFWLMSLQIESIFLIDLGNTVSNYGTFQWTILLLYDENFICCNGNYFHLD